MPLCYCFTNLKSGEVPEGFEERLSVCVKDVLNKPLENITVILQTDLRIRKAGNSDPALILQLHSISVFDELRNPDYFPKIFEFLKTELNLPGNRLTVEFVDLPAYMAQNGK